MTIAPASSSPMGFFSAIRAATAQRADALPVPRDRRLAQIRAELLRLSETISSCESGIKCGRADLADVLAGHYMLRDELIAERREIYQNPPEGRDSRLAGIANDIAASRRTLALPTISPWLRGVNEDRIAALEIEQADLLSVE